MRRATYTLFECPRCGHRAMYATGRKRGGWWFPWCPNAHRPATSSHSGDRCGALYSWEQTRCLVGMSARLTMERMTSAERIEAMKVFASTNDYRQLAHTHPAPSGAAREEER